jgi:endonuclease/exonuclease/phosphatase family metal-dependent hydrolase
MTKFRVLTANLCSVDQHPRIEALAETIATHQPDILLMQEVVDPLRMLDQLEARLGQIALSLYFNNNRKDPTHNEHLMVAVFGDAVTPTRADIIPRPQRFAGSTQLGKIGLLQPRTTGRIDAVFDQGFSLHAVHHDWANGTTLWHTTHRKRQMRQLLSDMSGHSIIAGDFNNGLGSPSVKMLRNDPRICGRATSSPTWPAEPYNFWQDNLLGFWSTVARWPERRWGRVLPNGELPRASIDNSYHTAGFECTGSHVLVLPGSDHLGVTADYELISA